MAVWDMESTTPGAGCWGSLRGLPPTPRRSLGREKLISGVLARPLAWQVWVGCRCMNTQAQWPLQGPRPHCRGPGLASQALLPGSSSVSQATESPSRPWFPGWPWSPHTCRHGVPASAVREKAPDAKNAAAVISPATQRRIPWPGADRRQAAQDSTVSPGVTQGHGKWRGDSGTRRQGGFPERMEQNRRTQNSRSSLASPSANLFQPLAH